MSLKEVLRKLKNSIYARQAKIEMMERDGASRETIDREKEKLEKDKKEYLSADHSTR